MKWSFLGVLFLFIAVSLFLISAGVLPFSFPQKSDIESFTEDMGGIAIPPHPLSIDALRSTQTPGSDLTIEEELGRGGNYEQFVASYLSEGNRIYGLLTIPTTQKPESGFPLIFFNHGYIPPNEYQTTQRYEAYVDAFARNGYIVFKSDYRGHGNSEGSSEGGYGSNAYTIDVLNGLETLKKHPDVDESRIGMWGHSMGGHITLRSMVVRDDIDAGVIWAGVVGSYPELVTNWSRHRYGDGVTPTPRMDGRRRWRDLLTEQYGSFEENPQFWDSISSTSYLQDVSGPIQIHHGTADDSVPVDFSRDLEKRLKDQKKAVEYFEYAGDNHNISFNFQSAMQQSVAFFDRYVKNAQ